MIKMANPATKWVDITLDEDEDFLQDLDAAKVYETPVDSDGIKTVTSYVKNEKGETYKVTKRVKVTRNVSRVNRAVYSRDKIQKFGKADDGSSEAFSRIAYEADEMAIDIPKRLGKNFQAEDEDNEELNSPQFLKELRELRNKFKTFRDELRLNDDSKNEDDSRLLKPSQHHLKFGEKYRAMDQQYKDESTVRVTNLSDYTEENDLKQLFGKIGPLQRIFLARDKETTNSKGFAFITYHRREDAMEAIRQLHRHGYDNLLLNVEWAKPSNRDR